MNSEVYWMACDQLSIFQAAFLIMGYNPDNLSHWQINRNRNEEFPHGYEALKKVLTSALCSKKIEGQKVFYDNQGHFDENNESYIDPDNTNIDIPSLKTYLKDKKLTDNFFFSIGEESAEYLNPSNEHYSPKLAAAINAWTSIIAAPELLKNKTPKQAIKKWLEKNAGDYGLKKDDGSLNNDAIENICKICNWKPEGGVSKTQTRTQIAGTRPPLKKDRKLKDFNTPINTPCPFNNTEEIPF